MNKKSKIGIIDCDFGNLASLENSIKFLNFDYQIIKDKINLNQFISFNIARRGFLQ